MSTIRIVLCNLLLLIVIRGQVKSGLLDCLLDDVRVKVKHSEAGKQVGIHLVYWVMKQYIEFVFADIFVIENGF